MKKISLKNLLLHYKGICHYCSQEVKLKDAEVYHLRPNSLLMKNSPNLVLVHKKCNK